MPLPSASPMKRQTAMISEILLINQPLRNRGDEAAHKAFVRRLLAAVPAARIEVLFVGEVQKDIDAISLCDSRVQYTNLRKGLFFWRVFVWSLRKNLPLRKLVCRLEPTVAAMRGKYLSADLIVCAPGGTCLGGQQNWMHLAGIELAASLGLPFAYFGRSIGPFPTSTATQRRFLRLGIDVLRKASFISLRDSVSMRYAEQLGLNAVPTLDSAFLAAPQPWIPAPLASLPEPGYSVFVPNALGWMYSFKGRLRGGAAEDFFRRIMVSMLGAAPGLRLLMLPQLHGQGTADDSLFFKTLSEGLPDDLATRVVLLPDGLNSDGQQAIVAGARCLVGARYHSIVFALNNAVPFLALSYEHKISGMLEALAVTAGETEKALDPADCCLDLEHAFDSHETLVETLARFDRLFASLIGRTADGRSAGRAALLRDRARAMAEKGFDDFKEAVL